jgi:UDP-galactopyranose mutase
MAGHAPDQSLVRCTIVGAGLTGSVAARRLTDAGWQVRVLEALDETGGNCRTGILAGVRYERCGPHIFHTTDPATARYAAPWLRPYTHRVQSLTDAGLLHWPPQTAQLRRADHAAHLLMGDWRPWARSG